MSQRIDRAADLCASVLFFPAAPFLWLAGRKRWSLRAARSLQDRLGVTVLRNHYYEPVLVQDRPAEDDAVRLLPGIDWNRSGQREILARFDYAEEIAALEGRELAGRRFFFENPMLGAGDAEALYCFIRAMRPRRLVEIGAGQSTLVARFAIAANEAADSGYVCRHISIEPFENPWLERTGAEIRRERLEEADPALFATLEANDILFLDSSHVLRAGGDVEHALLRIIPQLAPGVLVHIHDIYSPRDYPARWRRGDRRFWTEQYLLEAFLSFNDAFEVVLAMNLLYREGESELLGAFPVLRARGGDPGSFWIRRKSASQAAA